MIKYTIFCLLKRGTFNAENKLIEDGDFAFITKQDTSAVHHATEAYNSVVLSELKISRANIPSRLKIYISC